MEPRTDLLSDVAHPDLAHRDGTVPATARSWDAATGAGSVLLDDGRRVDFAADAWALSGLRLLRPGQRVRLSVRGGAVAAVTLATLPDPLDPVGLTRGAP